MGKSQRIKLQRDKRTLKALALEVKNLQVIRHSYNGLRIEFIKLDHSKRFWKNIAIAGIPIAILSGLALGIYLADTIMRNASS